MIRDEIRKLIGGYATGSLSEAEKKALFEAALDDQELFDELAREQALKETLDQPGAKQRLIAALGSPRLGGAGWRPWVWTAVAAMVALAMGVAGWMLLRAPKPVQIAVVQVPLAPPNGTPVVSQPEASKASPRAEPVKKAKDQTVAAEDRKQQPEPEAKPAPPVLKEDVPPPAAVSQAAPVPAPPPGQQQEASQQVQVQAQTGFRDSGQASTRGVVTGRLAPALPRRVVAPALARVNRFAFDYGFEAGFLTIKTAAGGTLSVSAATCLSCDGLVELLLTHVEKDSTTRIPVASQYVVLAITFSVQSSAAQSSLDAVSPTAKVTSKARAGTVEDPNPSPTSKLMLRLELQ